MCLFVLAVYLGGQRLMASNKSIVYVTVEGAGPDKWASAWLLSNIVSQNAEIKVVNKLSEISGNEIQFDTPDGQYRRGPGKTTFDHIIGMNQITDDSIVQIASVLKDIEINFWKNNTNPHSNEIESKFRALQKKYNNSVTPDCYIDFFEGVYQFISSNKELIVPDDCHLNHANEKTSITQIEIRDVLFDISSNRRVVFVDAREQYEFEEAHIPGAIRLPIRDVSAETVSSFKDADLVIAYCVKDFRGYELAKSLENSGVSNVAIMNPFGLKGWIHSGLPIVGSKGLSSEEAFKELKSIIPDRQIKQAAL